VCVLHAGRESVLLTGKEEDIDTHKRDGSALCSLIRSTGDRSCNGDDVLTHAHADRSKEKQVTSAEAFDHPKAGECGCYVDAVGDDLDDECIFESCVLEVLSPVVWQ
jgi:hypothetical protein